MTQNQSSFIAVVKRECPTCLLVVPVLKELLQIGKKVEIYCQDDESFHNEIELIRSDTNLEQSFRYAIECVPTLIRKENDRETGRVLGWNRTEWERLTGIEPLGEDLPENQPGCGSKTSEPGVQEKLQAQFGTVPISSRKIDLSIWDDPIELAYTRGWTDGLPIVPPTDDRILRMLAGTERQPDEVVGIMPPNMQECSVEKIAINAVMAGAKPEYMRVILAVVEAALKPEFALHGVLCTLSFSGPVILVNGPVTKAIGMNWGGNCLGQGNRANATIGRTLQLIVRNVGGGVPGEIDRAVFGNPGKYTYCFAEDETDPEWEPLHVSRGCVPGSDAVTLHQGHGLTAFVDNAARSADELARSLAAQLVNEVHPKKVQVANVIVALSPEHYQLFKADGWGRGEIEEALHFYTTRPGHDLIRGAQDIREGIDEVHAEEMMPKFWRDHGILLVRAGGPGGLLSAIIGGWSGGRNREEVQPVTLQF